MKSKMTWADKVTDKKGVAQPVYALAFKPDGTQLLAGAANRVLCYEAANGAMIHSCKGHKGPVYTLAWSFDGKYFASGAADENTIVWDGKNLEGVIKFAHAGNKIQCVAWSPVTNVLVSCSEKDFGFWEEKSNDVNKIQVKSRICCASWTNDGRYVALGMADGQISLREGYRPNSKNSGVQKIEIKPRGGAPIWSLSWNPSKSLATDELVVCDWEQKLSFYMLSGRQLRNPRALDYDPCSVSFFEHGDFFAVGGSDKQVALHTRTGVRLTTVCEVEGWVWSCAVRPKEKEPHIAVGCSDGTIALHELRFPTVHGLYKNRYAFRKQHTLTDVILRELSTKQEIRIKCKDLVKKIALFKNFLAVQLPKSINVYEISMNEVGDLKVKLPPLKIKESIECSLLVVCSRNIILCQDRRLQCLAFDGTREREWVMDAPIKYIKVVGGPAGCEGLLVGLKNGQVLSIYVNNAFPVELIKQGTPVRCLDINSKRNKIAVVDDNNTCNVYDLTTTPPTVLYQEPHANSVAWNSENEDVLCYSGGGSLHIKAAQYPVHRQKLRGFVVGFQGSEVFCLDVDEMVTTAIPQSYAMYQFLADGLFKKAYRVASLGVTEADWRALGEAALEKLELDIAKNCFIRVRDVRYLNLIHMISKQRKGAEFVDEEILLAQIQAHRGNFKKAAELFEKANSPRLAMEMYNDLRMFDKAKQYLEPGDAEGARMLMQRQREWSKAAKDPSVMIDIFLHAGELAQAIQTMGKHKMHQRLIDKARELNAGEMVPLGLIAKELSNLGHVALAAEVYGKLGDDRGLSQLYVKHERWTEAFALIQRNPELKEGVYLPYAHFLAERDQYDEAQDAFREAGHPDKAVKVLKVLTHNAVNEQRFDDAGYYFWQLSMAALTEMVESYKAGEDPSEVTLQKFNDYQSRANVYSPFHSIHRFMFEPFTSHLNENLFNMARYLLDCHDLTKFHGVSRLITLVALAKQSRNVRAFKVAREAFEELRKLRIPPAMRAQTDLDALAIRSKPVSNADEIAPIKFRKEFKYSAFGFEMLPVVEFSIPEDMEDAEAMALIEDYRQPGGGASNSGGADVMDLSAGGEGLEVFTKQYADMVGGVEADFEPIEATREMLLAMSHTEVFVERWPEPLSYRYFKNVLPEVPLAMCSRCFRMFHSDEFELCVLKENRCPFCRTAVDVSGGILEKPKELVNETANAESDV
eukprot:m.110473 g.110473  ORF g.110473 m.110473 type:complete len:1203 (-) comp12887_c0_seq1:313-3921(-)